MNNDSVKHPNYDKVVELLTVIDNDDIIGKYIDEFEQTERQRDPKTKLTSDDGYFVINDVLAKASNIPDGMRLWLHRLEKYLFRLAVDVIPYEGNSTSYAIRPGLAQAFDEKGASLTVRDGQVVLDVITGMMSRGFMLHAPTRVRFTFTGNTWPKPTAFDETRQQWLETEVRTNPSTLTADMVNAFYMFLSPLLTNRREGRVLRMTRFEVKSDQDKQALPAPVASFQIVSTTDVKKYFDFNRRHVDFGPTEISFGIDAIQMVQVFFYEEGYDRLNWCIGIRYDANHYLELVQDIQRFLITGEIPASPKAEYY